MDEEDIRSLIIMLRAMMAEAGFGWAVDQAEACLPIDASLHWRARALIDAAEAVTVGLAEAEISAQQSLGVGEITFTPDVGGAIDGDGVGDDAGPRLGPRVLVDEGADDQTGRQRTSVLTDLAGQHATFRELRNLLDVGQ